MNNENQSSYLSSLNPEQLSAVTHEGSPLLILAGAGTGKTRVIITKIAYLLREKHMSPESILAVTFTNKAAREMRERAANLEPQCERATIRTFHSFGAWFSRRHAKDLGLDPAFVIYDDADSTELLHSIYPQLSKQQCGRYASLIARAKDYCLDPDSAELGFLTKDKEFGRIFSDYEKRLRATGNVDFGDLIRLPSSLIEADEIIARRMRQRFEVVLVDEYQDSNIAQFKLLRNLVGENTYVCVVGDDDQSIYRFRGAEVKNILTFSSAFPGTEIIRLERNYRSNQSILDLAGNIVSYNAGRLGKTLRAMKPGGPLPRLALLDDQEQEVEYCSSLIRAHHSQGGRLSDFAILYRTNAQSLAFEKDFPRKGIPYRIVGALRFYEREEIKDTLAYLSLIVNPRDEIAFRRIVNKPTRGIGEMSVDLILDHAAKTSRDLLTSCSECVDSIHGKGKAGARDFLSLMSQYRDMIQGSPSQEEIETAPQPFSLIDGEKRIKDPGALSLGTLVQTIVKSSGLLIYHQDKDEIAGTQKSSNLDELTNAASQYPLDRDGLIGFLENIELDRSFQAGVQNESVDAVTLITMHNTKGLEFRIVIVTGLEQGLFPRENETGDDLEEQRRLFYVAVTRAKDALYLTACHWRRIHGQMFETTPSRFLLELNPSNYRREDLSGSFSLPARNSRIESPNRPSYRNSARPGYRNTFDKENVKSHGTNGGMRTVKNDANNTVSQSGSEHERSPDNKEDSVWKMGMSVYHDEFGSGTIVKVSMSASSGPLVVVRFETGKLAQFFPKYTKKLERIQP
jgi:DNA helicase-2/ATP-dependent DNA helicase PcrA